MSNDSDIGLYFIIPLSALILLSITNDLIFFQAFFPKRQIIKQWLLWSRSAKKPTPCATWRLLFFKEQSNKKNPYLHLISLLIFSSEQYVLINAAKAHPQKSCISVLKTFQDLRCKTQDTRLMICEHQITVLI